jgi:glycine/D-amino acid oxidase-like deaminating enzyme
MRRRDVLAGGAAVVALGAAGAGPARAEVREISAPFSPVKSSRDRVIRTVVGLRPFRKSGFRLEAVKQGRKDIVHNYGHGGGGVSLSWGCAEMAAKLALGFGRSEVAVMGSGVMGLSTAILLQQKGCDVTIHAESFPPYTTSNIAGAMWHPVTLYDEDAVTPEFKAVLDVASRRAHARFQRFVNDPRYGVYWIREFQLRETPFRQPLQPHPGGDDLYPGMIRDQSGKGPFGFSHWEAYYTPMIDPDFYLRALVNDFLAAGGKMVEQTFADERDVATLKPRTIVNCLGLGAGKVFGDEEMTPIRGQLTMLLPQPEIDYGYVASVAGKSLYMFPRKTCIVLGGTGERGDWNLEPVPEEIERMVTGHAMLAGRANG